MQFRKCPPDVAVRLKSTDKIFRAHCFKRNGWRSSLYVSVSDSIFRLPISGPDRLR